VAKRKKARPDDVRPDESQSLPQREWFDGVTCNPALEKAYASYLKAWRGCTRCSLHENAENHVMYRGNLPCDVLFVGEAPGKSENKIGKPFIGPAGRRILDPLIEEAQRRTSPPKWTYGITNTVACIPLESEKLRVPTREEQIECLPRLVTLLGLANPEVVVFLGRTAENSTFHDEILRLLDKKDSRLRLRSCHHIVHPAYILRQGGSKTVAYKQAMISLVQFIKRTI